MTWEDKEEREVQWSWLGMDWSLSRLDWGSDTSSQKCFHPACLDDRWRLLTITLKNTEPWRRCGGDFSHFVAFSRQYKPWCHKDNDKNLSHPFCNHRICGLAKACIMLNYNFWAQHGVSQLASDNDSGPRPSLRMSPRPQFITPQR